MINAKYNNHVLVKRTSNAFVRDELEGYQLIIPKGLTQSEALLANKEGKEIISLIDGKKTILDIISSMSEIYPEVPYSTIQNDVYKFVNNLIISNIVRLKEADDMYKGKVIGNMKEFDVYRCCEGDYKLIYDILHGNEKKLDVLDVNVSDALYDAINLRVKLFNYIEDFYVLKDKTKPYALLGIVNGKSLLNKTPFLSRIILLEQLDKVIVSDFIKISANDYKTCISQDSKKIRFSFMDSTDSNIIREILSMVTFTEVAKLKDEFGDTKDLLIYDYHIE